MSVQIQEKSYFGETFRVIVYCPTPKKAITRNSFTELLNPISTGLFYLVVALGGGGGEEGSHRPSIKFDPDILEH